MFFFDIASSVAKHPVVTELVRCESYATDQSISGTQRLAFNQDLPMKVNKHPGLVMHELVGPNWTHSKVSKGVMLLSVAGICECMC